MKIIADEQIPYVADYFGPQGELILKPGRAISRKDVKNADILLVRSITNVDETLLAGSRVKFVGSVTAGADHLEVNWLTHSGIAWHVAEGFNAPPVADYVVCTIAALQRKQLLPVKGIKAAVIGVGNVGRLVVDKLKIVGCDVICCDPYRAEEAGFHHVPLDDIADVDIVLLHTPLTRDGPHPTFHCIGKPFLMRQKPGCVLLNAGRGSVVNSQALMLYGTHLMWCLDVFEHEPKIDKAILNRTVIGTPHIAGYSVQSKVRGIEMIFQLAAKKGLVNPALHPVIEMPSQHLAFSGKSHHWQDVVLGIFNPLVMSAVTREALLSTEDDGKAFDKLRHDFNYRHEFAFTKLDGVDVADEDATLLVQLGVKFAANA